MTWSRVCKSILLALPVLATGPAWAQASRPDAPSASPLTDRVIPLEAKINGTPGGMWPFVERQGQLYVGKDAFEEWRVSIPATAQPITVRRQDYWPLSAIPGFTMKVDYATQSVEIDFAPEAFPATKLTRELHIPKPSPVLPALFLNYDLNLQTTQLRGEPKLVNDLGALMEVGASGTLGVVTSTIVGRQLLERDRSAWTRLETTYTRHMPDRAMTLRLGDAATRSGLWGNSVYFGGLQIGSNYTLTPGFLTQPLPLVGGVSAAPSTVQLYVNDVLRKVSEVPAGPFVIDNIGGLSGAGETKLVVRDILGREVVYVQRFFTSGQLLAVDLADWSVETGWLREDLGVRSFSYGNRFLSGTYRRGITNGVTLETRGELTRHSQTVGVGGITALPFEVLARGALVASNYSGYGHGGKMLLAAERLWSQSSVYLQLLMATRHYTEIGRGPSAVSSKLEWAANYGWLLSQNWGRIGVNIVGVERYGAPNVTTVSLNYTLPLRSKATLSANVSRAFGAASGGTLLGLSLSLPLDERRQARVTSSSHGGVNDIYASASQSSGRDVDLSWRVLGGRIQNEQHSEAGLYYGGRYGRAFGEISESPNQTTLRSGLTGGLVYAAGRPFLSQRVDQSFGIVEVKGFRDIGVGLGSTVTTRTDENGLALVPFLTPYQQNYVRLNATDLPMSAEVESIEKTVVPVWRSAVKIDFPVRSGRAALVRLVLDDGDPAPAGGVVQIEGDQEEFYVARRGEVYVTGLQPDSRLQLKWNDQTCNFTLTLPKAAEDEVARVGPVRCAGMRR